MINKGLFLLLLLVSFNLSGQRANSFLENGLEIYDITKRLPPLDSLISWAKTNNANLKSFKMVKELGEGRVHLEKRAWLKYLKLDASYGYGIYDNLNNQQIGGDPSSLTLFSSKQSRYNFGGSVSMPLEAILNRKRSIKNVKLEADTFKYEQEQATTELELEVTTAYNDVVKFHKLLFINTTMVDMFRGQTARAEKEYLDGALNVYDYTRLLQMINQAQVLLETQKTEFFKAFMILESTVGVDLKI